MSNSKDRLKKLQALKSDPQESEEITESKTDENRTPYRPHLWKPGQSGNPGGRPKGVRAVLRDLVGEHGEKVLAILWDISQGKQMDVPGTINEPGSINLERVPSLELQAAMSKYLFEWAFGKAPDKLEVSGPEGGPIQSIEMQKLSADDVKQLIAIKQKLLADENK